MQSERSENGSAFGSAPRVAGGKDIPLMDADDIRRAVTRIGHEIVEKNHGATDLALVGILTRGAPLAERLGAVLRQIEGVDVPVGRLDIGLYRDDYGVNPADRPGPPCLFR